jgi:hypothetical protein
VTLVSWWLKDKKNIRSNFSLSSSTGKN